MTMVVMPFTKDSRDKIKAGTKTATARKTKYGFAGDMFMVAGVLYRITEVQKLMLVRVAFDWFKEEGFGSPEDFVESWVSLHPRIGYTPGRVVFLHLFVKA